MTWDETTHTIEATVIGVTSIDQTDEVIIQIPSTLTGQDGTAAGISLNGEARLPLRPYTSFTADIPSRELVPGGILLMFRTLNSYRLLEPHVLERAGVWNDTRIYLRGQDVIRGELDYKLLNEMSVNEDPATNPLVWLSFPHIWQDSGTLLTDVVTGVNFEGDGVSTAVANGVLTLTIAGGGGTAPTHTDQYLAGKSTRTFAPSDFTGAQGVAYGDTSHTATLPTITGNVFGGVARLSSDPTPTFADVNGTGLNQFNDFTLQAGTITIGVDTYDVYVSDYAVFVTGDQVEFR